MTEIFEVKIGERWYTVEILDLDADPVQVTVDGEPVQVSIERKPTVVQEPARPSVSTSERAKAPPVPSSKQAAVVDYASKHPVSPDKPNALPALIRAPTARKLLSTPMPGIILSVKVQVGDTVVTGDEICVLEAMKMQQNLRSDWSGIIKTVHVKAGQQVLGGHPIAELE